MKIIGHDFPDVKLSDISDSQLDRLKAITCHIFVLCFQNGTSIDGFKASYFSALFHAYFPSLIPILDRRILNGLHLITEKDLTIFGQIKDIHKFYPTLLDHMRTASKNTGKTLRALDGDYFACSFPYWRASD